MQTIDIVLLFVYEICKFKGSENDNSKKQDVYTINMRAKQTSRLEAECPSHIYRNILKLIRRCEENRDADNLTNHLINHRADVNDQNSLTSTEPVPPEEATTFLTHSITSSYKIIDVEAMISSEGDARPTSGSPKVHLPQQCTSPWTLNLTEAYRIQHTDRSGSIPSDEGHLGAGRVWFRFQGAAGNQLATTCPKKYNYSTRTYGCGWYSTFSASYWSNSTMPDRVGQTNQIVLYRGPTPMPKDVYRGLATRCSENKTDLVYKIVDVISSSAVVCGNND